MAFQGKELLQSHSTPSLRTITCRQSTATYSIHSLQSSPEAVPLSATWACAIPWRKGSQSTGICRMSAKEQNVQFCQRKTDQKEVLPESRAKCDPERVYCYCNKPTRGLRAWKWFSIPYYNGSAHAHKVNSHTLTCSIGTRSCLYGFHGAIPPSISRHESGAVTLPQ
jgi:hypothetical protein